ncbi:TetR/AcrR family transcriptional regulator [Thioclava sp. BHET1]|nr:TetR/AcrR family transcriptional regulator [Thioclava sp. BHET1]
MAPAQANKMKLPARSRRPARPQSDGKREQIAAAALRVMLQKGVFDITTRKIAAEAEISVATLHYHFNDKEEIIFSVMENFVSQYRSRLNDALGDSTDLPQRIEVLIHFVCSEIRRAPAEQILLQEMSIYMLRHPEGQDLARAKDVHFQDLYASALSRLVEETPEAQQKVRALSNLIYTSLVGLFNQWLATQDDPLFDRSADNLITAAKAFAAAQGLSR